MTDLEKIQHLSKCITGEGEAERVEALAGDVSARRYYRVYPKATRPSYIVAIYPQNFDLNLSAAEILEKPLYNIAAPLGGELPAEEARALTWANNAQAHLEATAFLRAGGLPVPAIRLADGELGAVAQEDVGDLWLQTVVEGKGQSTWQKWYDRAFDLMIQIQKETPRALSAEIFATKMALNAPKLRWELDFFTRHYWHGRGRSDAEEQVRLRLFQRLCDGVGEFPQVLCHRDYHARNLMVWGQDDALYVIDHQDLRMGPRTYDLVSLAEDPYTQPPRAIAEALYGRYADYLGISLAELEEELYWVMAQRLIKAAGTYACQYFVHGKTSFLSQLAPTIARANQALRALSGFEELADLLEQSCPV